jgi:hypothetical protein
MVVSCIRSKPAQDAIVDFRMLGKAPAAGHTRITGCVRGPVRFGLWARPAPQAFVAGAQIQVTGPAYSRTVRTDSSGLYELDDLEPGDYTLGLSIPATQVAGCYGSDESPAGIHLTNGGVVERNFYLCWNGRIEGKVKDDAGEPAQASVILVSADHNQMPGYLMSAKITAKDGSSQIQRIPPGRYMVAVNPDGPYRESPYALQYYPSTVQKDKARVFELGTGQLEAGIDFRVPVPAERSTQVRVTWPNGTAAAGAQVSVAYENTDGYDSWHYIRETDQNGLAVIHTYGKSQVRVFAEQSLSDGRNDHWCTPVRVQSRRVQYAADQTPNTINLVLTSSKWW